MRRTKLTPEDWAQAALRTIAREGFSGVSIAKLAKKLRVTKGSFYWHFKDRTALLRAAVDRWEAKATQVLEALGQVPEPRARLRAVFDFLGGDVEFLAEDAAITASPEAWVQRKVARAYEQRLALLRRTYAEIAPDDAEQRATVGLAAYLGTLRLLRSLEGPALQAHLDHAAEVLIP
ncbi:MAG: TetR/AcrR family transcriptional regulator [Myxococcota bacterium]